RFDGRSGGWVPTLPPAWAVQALAARGQWPGLRMLEGIVEAPALRLDGTVLDTPGYDVDTGLLFEPTIDFGAIPQSPTRDDALTAKELLLEVVADFPFAARHHLSAWLATVLTYFARPAFEGQVPVVVIDANTRGSGKGLLADTISVICIGRPVPRMANTTND